MSKQLTIKSAEIVPLAERLRFMQLFRVVAALLVLFYWSLSNEDLAATFVQAMSLTGAYLVLSAASEGLWRVAGKRSRGLLIFGAMLLIDGVFLAWISYWAGGNNGPLRFLILLHLITATLLASYRTGLKLALWHSLLLFVVYYGQDVGLIPELMSDMEAGIRPFAVFVLVFWLTTIGTAAFSAINERELRRRRFEAEALARMAEELETVTVPFEVAETVVNSIADTFELERAVLMGAPEGDLTLVAYNLSIMAYKGEGQPSHSATGVDALVKRAWDRKATVLMAELDAEQNPRLASLFPGASNIAVVPMYAEGVSIGVLVVQHQLKTGSRIERRIVSMIEQFASHGALAMRNAWLLERIQSMAATDGLTGIANRRTFDVILEKEVMRAERNGEPLALVMVDIDHFKEVNDNYGHLVGDDYLRRVADAMVGCARRYDTVARYGGEEFCIVLPGTGIQEAAGVAERLRTTVAAIDTGVDIRISAGVAVFPTNASDQLGFVKAADDALYESKLAGRNRVSISRAGTDQQRVAGID